MRTSVLHPPTQPPKQQTKLCTNTLFPNPSNQHNPCYPHYPRLPRVQDSHNETHKTWPPSTTLQRFLPPARTRLGHHTKTTSPNYYATNDPPTDKQDSDNKNFARETLSREMDDPTRLGPTYPRPTNTNTLTDTPTTPSPPTDHLVLLFSPCHLNIKQTHHQSSSPQRPLFLFTLRSTHL